MIELSFLYSLAILDVIADASGLINPLEAACPEKKRAAKPLGPQPDYGDPGKSIIRTRKSSW